MLVLLNYLVLIFSVIALLLLGAFTLLKREHNIPRLFFGLYAVIAAFWLLAAFLENESIGLTLQALFLRLDLISGITSIYLLFLLALYFPQPHTRFKYIEHVTGGVVALFVVLSSIGGLIARNIHIEDGRMLYEYGVLYDAYSLFVLFLVITSLARWILFYRRSRGIDRLQIKYIFLGYAIALGIILPFVVFLQNYVSVEVFRLASYSIVAIPFFTGYAILRHRLMDIRIVLQRGTVYSLLLATIGGVYALTLFAAQRLFALPAQYAPHMGLVLMLVGIFGYRTLEQLFTRLTDPIFFRRPIKYRETLEAAQELYAREYSSDTVITQTLLLIKNQFKVSRVTFVYCAELEHQQCRFYRTEKGRVDQRLLNIDDELVKYFKVSDPSTYLVLSDLERGIYPDALQTMGGQIGYELRRLDAEACFPVVHKDNLLAIICVGTKESGDPYFENDIQWFQLLARQLGIALERSQLYEHLNEMVSERTFELKTANAALRHINEAKTEFVSIASHQLRAPLTVIKSIFSLMVAGDLGKITKEQKNYIDRGLTQSERLIRLIGQLLEITRIEAGRTTLTMTSFDLNDLVREFADPFRTIAKAKGLELTIVPSDVPVIVQGDRALIGESVSNLLDNAIKFTELGSVTISVYGGKKDATISVADTGAGLAPGEADRLFKRFITGADTPLAAHAGTGLGLYFVRRVLEAHGGAVHATSMGPGSGSVFSITLARE